jgi:hypothetical protein
MFSELTMSFSCHLYESVTLVMLYSLDFNEFVVVLFLQYPKNIIFTTIFFLSLTTLYFSYAITKTINLVVFRKNFVTNFHGS